MKNDPVYKELNLACSLNLSSAAGKNRTKTLFYFRKHIRNALNQQTAIQFKQYSEQQFPGNPQQVGITGYYIYGGTTNLFQGS